jgi:4-hydroxy-tetrahydrodipicolinate synthase
MASIELGLVHTPVTSFTSEESIDYRVYGNLIEFHLQNGAEALALPMHIAESVSLTDVERQRLLEFALKKVNGRVPVIAHVSQSGTSIAVALAKHAAEAGASAIVATTPYYWTPPPAMLLEHFTQIGKGAGIPFFVYNSPEEMGGVKVTTDLTLKLIEKLDNFVGLVDLSLDWQFLIEVISSAKRLRSGFQLLTGVEYMISAGAIGATGMFTSLSGIAPKAVRKLWDICKKENYKEARPVQEALAALRQAVKPKMIAGLKSAMRHMERDCGQPRPPLDVLEIAEEEKLYADIRAIEILNSEPKGWVKN